MKEKLSRGCFNYKYFLLPEFSFFSLSAIGHLCQGISGIATSLPLFLILPALLQKQGKPLIVYSHSQFYDMIVLL